MGGEESRNVRAEALCSVIAQPQKNERVRERREEGGKSDCWEVEAFSKGGVTQASTGEQKLFHVWIETAQLIYYSRILLKKRLETLTY